MRTYAVLVKGVHKSLLSEDMTKVAKEVGERNEICIYRARARIFKPNAPYQALLLEFTRIQDANKLCNKGMIWRLSHYDCEVYCGDLRPILYYNCWQYSHKSRFCTKRAIYPHCATPRHAEGTPCPVREGHRPYFCPACKGPHRVFNRECPEANRRWKEVRQLHKCKSASTRKRLRLSLRPNSNISRNNHAQNSNIS